MEILRQQKERETFEKQFVVSIQLASQYIIQGPGLK